MARLSDSAAVEVRCTIELRELLDARYAAIRASKDPVTSTYIIVSEETGLPYRRHNFAYLFGAIRDCAEIEGLRFQDLRRTSGVSTSRAGATPPEIAAVTGHTIDRVVTILETYLPRDAIMADHAITKLEAWKQVKKTAREQAV